MRIELSEREKQAIEDFHKSVEDFKKACSEKLIPSLKEATKSINEFFIKLKESEIK